VTLISHSTRTIRLHNPPVIAVIEDDGAVRDALSELLEVTSFSCRAFDRAESFLADFSPERFDCIITDLRLPGISGLDLQRRLKAQGTSLPLIFITSSVDTLPRTRAIQEGAHAYLTKPVNGEVLLGHVAAAIGHKD
jgi:FixJ family two-component response regulator